MCNCASAAAAVVEFRRPRRYGKMRGTRRPTRPAVQRPAGWSVCIPWIRLSFRTRTGCIPVDQTLSVSVSRFCRSRPHGKCRVWSDDAKQRTHVSAAVSVDVSQGVCITAVYHVIKISRVQKSARSHQTEAREGVGPRCNMIQLKFYFLFVQETLRRDIIFDYTRVFLE